MTVHLKDLSPLARSRIAPDRAQRSAAPALEPAQQRKAERGQSKGSGLELEFVLLWRALKGPALEREFRFDETRRWRADFANRQAMTLIELEGGVWTNGAHARGGHFISDCEKYNEAAFLGWTVFRIPTGGVNTKCLERIIRFVRAKW